MFSPLIQKQCAQFQDSAQENNDSIFLLASCLSTMKEKLITLRTAFAVISVPFSAEKSTHSSFSFCPAQTSILLTDLPFPLNSRA